MGSDWIISADLVMRLGTVFCCLARPSSIRIPGNVREIGARAFYSENSLIDLSFEEGTERIGSHAFTWCSSLENAAFPASLIVIEANAFCDCDRLRRITFATASQLQYIRGMAFFSCPLNKVVVPATIREIDPSAFSPKVWRSCVTFEGPPLFFIDDDLIEVIGTNAFEYSRMSAVPFASSTRLREIGREAFACCYESRAFTVPESVEILGDRCFEDCRRMETITFEGSSRLKAIGEGTFMRCKLHSITIPASTDEIDGSAFLNCPLITIQVAPGSQDFKIEANVLATSDGTELVRYFGLDPGIFVWRKVKVVRNSCFEGCKHLGRIDFETGSELERIGAAALLDCDSLVNIKIPTSVRIVEETSFEVCSELGSCSIDENSLLVTIGAAAFAKTISLMSFCIPRLVGAIDSNCFNECLHQNC
jgi:hypothetical protein